MGSELDIITHACNSNTNKIIGIDKIIDKLRTHWRNNDFGFIPNECRYYCLNFYFEDEGTEKKYPIFIMVYRNDIPNPYIKVTPLVNGFRYAIDQPLIGQIYETVREATLAQEDKNMPTTEKSVSVEREQDLFLGTDGIRPNSVTAINPEQAQRLQGECGETPMPALQEAFEARKQNQAKSKAAK